MKRLLLFVTLLNISNSEFINKKAASKFLHRVARSNRGSIFEELHPGNFERECVEETCNAEEAFEISDNRAISDKLWRRYSDCRIGRYTSGRALDSSFTRPELRKCVEDTNQCEPYPCLKENTVKCQDRLNDFRCLCKPGFEGKLCEIGESHCQSYPCRMENTEICEDIPNDFRCVCKLGYEGKSCERSVDACSLQPCNEASTDRCVNLGVAFRCECKTGYRGELCQFDIDNCLGNPCGDHGSCRDDVIGYTCLCDAYYSGILCENIVSDCRRTGCGEKGQCSVNRGVYSCICDERYSGILCDEPTDTETGTDVETYIVTGEDCLSTGCTSHAQCLRNDDVFRCVCDEGYSGTNCDKEEILDDCRINGCLSRGRCIDNSDGDYACDCDHGFAGKFCNKTVLSDCRQTGCNSRGECSMLDDVVYICACYPEYSGEDCSEVNPPVDVEEDCRAEDCGLHGRCVANDDVYQCSCFKGYTGSRCDEDQDECSTSSPCQHNCTNTIGSFKCSCNSGFLLDLSDTSSCNDIDECVMTSTGCSDTCVNTLGSFYCDCKEGFAVDSFFRRYCRDVDECLQDNGGCAGKCLNSEGSFTCVCFEGYKSDDGATTCQDIDECAGDSGCQFACINTEGSFACSCPEGFLINYDKKTCRDVNECLSTSPCEQICQNLPGSFNCKCEKGFVSNDTQCDDIDECAIDNGGCDDVCTNAVGSYKCDCGIGFELVGKNCFDILECASDPCVNGRCLDGFNSYTCSCYYGYSGTFCEEEANPCSDQPCTNGTCTVIGSSFSCACNQGYTGNTCNKDVDECAVDNGNCASLCVNTEGSYTCICGPGFTASQDNSCIDINECEDNSTCDEECVNTSGSFVCSCRDGFTSSGENGACIDVNECEQRPCEQECNNTKGSFYCSCRQGYQLHDGGLTCPDVDECSSGVLNICGQNCNNLIGSFKCSCREGFQLSSDKITCQESANCYGNLDESLKKHLQIGSESNDYLTLKVLKEIQKKLYFYFRFRTFDTNGLLVAIGDEQSSKYAFVTIRDGYINAGYNRGSDPLFLNPAEPVQVSDGEWHEVKYRKFGKKAKVIVDNIVVSQENINGVSAKFKSGTFIYFGGLPRNHSLLQPISISPQFRGCMSNIQVKGGKIQWLPSKKKTLSQHGGCFSNVDSTGIYFYGTGYAAVESYRRSNDFKITIKLRTGHSDGVIVAMGDGSFNLTLVNGELIAESQGGATQPQARSRYAAKSVCGGLWISIYCKVARGKIQLRVDGVLAKYSTRGQAVRFDHTTPVYLGGLPDYSGSRFQGNMRRISINDKTVNIKSSCTQFQGVNVMSMPAH